MKGLIIRTVFCLLVFLLIISCVDSSTTTRNYRIINGTIHTVELRFYKGSIATEERSFVFKEEIEGEGLILERTLKTYALDTNGPTDVFEADSVAVIFNKERVEGHLFIEPMSGSIMNLGDYERNGEQFTYTITEENYNNATPCDGPCN